MVSAWASEARLVLAQRAVADQANERSALPEVLALLALEGCIVTIDAMGAHPPLTQQIVAQGADYVLALKENQERLYSDVVAHFADVERWGDAPISGARDRWVDGGHGRIEVRQTATITDATVLAYLDPTGLWPALHSVVMVRATRQMPAGVAPRKRGKSSYGETISTAFVESTLNQVMSKRMAKKQQMRWTRRGAHQVLQVRSQVLDGELRRTFCRWYSGMLPDDGDVAA